MRRRYLHAALCLACFGAGAYAWRVRNTGLITPPNAPAELPSDLLPSSVIVEVGDEKITQEDVNWEFDLLTEGVFDRRIMTPIPDPGPRYPQELAALRQKLAGNLIERKLLYAAVKQDRTFTVSDSARYTECLTTWKESLKAPIKAFRVAGGRERLKAQLCERSIIDQYMRERLFAGFKADNAAILEYYLNHRGEFHEPERVTVRQVVLADEPTAKRVRAQITGRNFAELARRFSITPEAAKGGLLGPFGKGSLPGVFDVAFTMHKGAISPILKSHFGFHIIQLVERRPRQELSLEQARPHILAALRREYEEAAYSVWVEKALARVTVTTPKSLW